MERQNTVENEYHILDLNEYNFHQVFRYLEYKEIYHNLRVVCRSMKDYVESYMKISGTFMLASNTRVNHNRIIQIFNRKNKIVYFHSKTVPALPSLDHPYISFKLFGTTINGKIAVGVLAKSPVVTYKSNFDCEFVIYNLKKDENNELVWVKIKSKDEGNNKTYYMKDNSQYISSCCIQDKIGKSLLFYNSLPTYPYGVVEMVIMNFSDNSQNVAYYMNRFPCFHALLQCAKCVRPSRLNYTSKLTFRPLDSNSLIGFSIAQVRDNRILLVGGKDEMGNPNLVVWQGSFVGTSFRNLSWVPLELPLITSRFQPLCFKLGHNLYIAGGYCIENDSSKDGEALYCCDNYNLQEGKYYENVYCLPCAVSDANKVVANMDETYALIMVNKNQSSYSRRKTNYITFTPEVGFAELTGVEFDEDLVNLELNYLDTTLFKIE